MMYKKNILPLALFLISAEQALAQGGATAPVQLKNPLKATSIQGLLLDILNILIILAVPIIVFFIIYAGFLYTTARGNASQIEQATRALTYAVIGGVLIIGAVAIAEIVRNLVTSF
jgi:Type IV secretion system pilin